MEYKIINKSNKDIKDIEDFVSNFFPYSQKRLQFDKPVTIIFKSDGTNAQKLLGKTAYYDPENLEVVLYIDGRHPKDIIRSLSHELVHHAQNCRGEFDESENIGETGYAQKDPHLRKMEGEAYLLGNFILRDHEDAIKGGKITVDINEKKLREKIRKIAQSIIKEDKTNQAKLSDKEWSDNRIFEALKKKWTK